MALPAHLNDGSVDIARSPALQAADSWSRWKVMLDAMFRIFFRLVLVNVLVYKLYRLR